jgi:hypothetical protein
MGNCSPFAYSHLLIGDLVDGYAAGTLCTVPLLSANAQFLSAAPLVS